MIKVLLINRQFGAGVQQRAVCGISSKLYGQADFRAEHKGLVFEMSGEEYAACAFDLVGNISPAAGQVWVPVFIETDVVAEPSENINELRKQAKELGIDSRGMDKPRLAKAIQDTLQPPPPTRCDARGCGSTATQSANRFFFCDEHAPLDAADLPGRAPRKEAETTDADA